MIKGHKILGIHDRFAERKIFFQLCSQPTIIMGNIFIEAVSHAEYAESKKLKK